MLLRYWRTSHSRRPAANGWTRWNEPPRTPSLWERITSRLRNRRTEQPGNARHTATRQNDYDYNIRRRQEEQRMDELLDKIRQSGYDSLTQEEKQELFRISRR